MRQAGEAIWESAWWAVVMAAVLLVAGTAGAFAQDVLCPINYTATGGERYRVLAADPGTGSFAEISSHTTFYKAMQSQHRVETENPMLDVTITHDLNLRGECPENWTPPSGGIDTVVVGDTARVAELEALADGLRGEIDSLEQSNETLRIGLQAAEEEILAVQAQRAAETARADSLQVVVDSLRALLPDDPDPEPGDTLPPPPPTDAGMFRDADTEEVVFWWSAVPQADSFRVSHGSPEGTVQAGFVRDTMFRLPPQFFTWACTFSSSGNGESSSRCTNAEAAGVPPLPDPEPGPIEGAVLQTGPASFPPPQVHGHTPAMELPAGALYLRLRPRALVGEQGVWSKDHSGHGAGGHLGALLRRDTLVVRLQSQTESVEVRRAGFAAGAEREAVVVFGDSLRLFVDGVRRGGNSYGGGLQGNTEAVRVGASAARAPAGSQEFEAAFDGLLASALIGGQFTNAEALGLFGTVDRLAWADRLEVVPKEVIFDKVFEPGVATSDTTWIRSIPLPNGDTLVTEGTNQVMLYAGAWVDGVLYRCSGGQWVEATITATEIQPIPGGRVLEGETCGGGT